jgi:hypothetical protein
MVANSPQLCHGTNLSPYLTEVFPCGAPWGLFVGLRNAKLQVLATDCCAPCGWVPLGPVEET